MVFLRATQKVLRRLPQSGSEGASDTALGDWYVNRIVVDRKPLLVLVSATSLLAMITPARNIRQLPALLPAMVEDRLGQLGIAEDIIARELEAMATVHVGPTRDRSVVGIMVLYGQELPFHLDAGGWGERDLEHVEYKLWGNPCYASKAGDAIFPYLAAPALLQRKWGG